MTRIVWTLQAIEREAYREVILGAYRVVYRLGGDQAEILTVVQAARLLPDF